MKPSTYERCFKAAAAVLFATAVTALAALPAFAQTVTLGGNVVACDMPQSRAAMILDVMCGNSLVLPDGCVQLTADDQIELLDATLMGYRLIQTSDGAYYYIQETLLPQ